MILFVTLIISSCSKETITPDEEYPDKKYLESFTAYMIPYKYGLASESDKYKWEIVLFNPDSTIKKRAHRSTLGFTAWDIAWDSEENFYENEMLKEQIAWHGLIPWTGSRERKVYSYSDNLLSSIYVYGELGLTEKDIYEYSGSNKVSRMFHYSLFDDFENPTIHVYSYDTNGNMIRDSIDYKYNSYGILEWEYDSFNNMIKESYYSSSSGNTSVQKIRKYTYDNEGKIIQYIFSYSFNFQKYLYQYLDNGLISQIDVFESKNGIDGNFEQKGILKYEYNYKDYSR
ncbi:hypothetical protein ES705_08208 [subsurface metagenome]